IAERQALGDVDSFIFVYPFWFNAPPAILKGYVDRVFSMGFGYAAGAGGADVLCLGEMGIGNTTIAAAICHGLYGGAPEDWVKTTGALKALMTVFDLHLSGVCGLRVLDHKHFGSIVSNTTAESGADVMEEVRSRLDDLFGSAPA
ncbi:MAG: NAD(P)H dehydrogenase, partial [Caulobacter sp. 39-67-4]